MATPEAIAERAMPERDHMDKPPVPSYSVVRPVRGVGRLSVGPEHLGSPDGGMSARSKYPRGSRVELTRAEFEVVQEMATLAAEGREVEGVARDWFELLGRVIPFVGISLSTYSPLTGAPRSIAAEYPERIVFYLDDGYLRHDRAYRGMVRAKKRHFNWSTAGFDYASSPSARDWFRPAGYSGGSTSMLFTRTGRYAANLHISTESGVLPDSRMLNLIQLVAPIMAAAVDERYLSQRMISEFAPGACAAFVRTDGSTTSFDGDPTCDVLGSGSPLVELLQNLRELVGDALTSPRRWLWCSADGTWHSVTCVRVRGELLALHEPVVGGSLLTPREREVVAMVSAGATNRVIAKALRISERTVARHVENIMVKTGAGSRTVLAVRAVSEGWGALTENSVRVLQSHGTNTVAQSGWEAMRSEFHQ